MRNMLTTVTEVILLRTMRQPGLTLMILVITYKASAVSVPADTIARLNEIDEYKKINGKHSFSDGAYNDQTSHECERCRTIHVKDCTITMRKVVTPLNVKRCVARKMVESA